VGVRVDSVTNSLWLRRQTTPLHMVEETAEKLLKNVATAFRKL